MLLIVFGRFGWPPTLGVVTNLTQRSASRNGSLQPTHQMRGCGAGVRLDGVPSGAGLLARHCSRGRAPPLSGFLSQGVVCAICRHVVVVRVSRCTCC